MLFILFKINNMFISTIPKIFQTKKNKVNTYALSKPLKDELMTSYNNYVYKPKHYPPFAKEWLNSIYTFNKNIIKLLPNLDISTYNLVKSYFNLYALKFNKSIRAKRLRIRTKKSSTNRLIASKPSLKHTNDKVNITIYTYDRSTKYYTNKLINTTSLDQLDGKTFSVFLKNLRQKGFKLGFNIEKGANALLEKITLKNHQSLFKYLSRIHYNTYIAKSMRKEIISIFYKQSLSFEQSKYEKQHLLLLASLVEKIYNKKVVLDIVNLKYFYNSSSIFSSTLMTKLKKRKNKPVKILTHSLDTFDIPPLDRINTYNEMYNKKKFIQNASIKNIASYNDELSNSSFGSYTKVLYDILEKSLESSSKYSNISSININDSTPNILTANSNKIIASLKNKFTSGIRIEIAGRLTKRNTAERSVFKLRYKGNIKNADSSYKGLSTVLLRGHAKSNLVYNESKSRLRIGAFGLKTWVSSN